MRSIHRAGPATCGRCSILIAAIVSICCCSLIQQCQSETAYEVLEEYDFPIGLLPTNVENYTLDTSDGSFEVYLSSICSFTIHSYTLTYQKTITGEISTDTLKDLSGVTVKLWIFSFSITKVIRDGTKLKFYVGSISKSFAVSSFDECQDCDSSTDCLSNFSRLLQIT